MFLNFYREKIFGLDISDYSIEIILLGGSINAPKLLAMGRSTLEPGIIEDGRIIKKEEIKNALQNLVKNPEFGMIRTKRFIFTLPESKIFYHIFNLPRDLKKEQEQEFIESQAIQTFPFLLKDIYFDFQKREKADFKEILLVASPKNIVDDFLDVFQSCQLQPLVIESESESLARALITDKKEVILIVDIGARTTNLSIFDESGLRLSNSVKIAGNKFTRSLTEKFKISYQDAEKLKRKVGLNPEPEEGKVFFVLQKEVQAIIWEIRRTEDYFQKKEKKSIGKMILAGGSSSLPFLREYLAGNLKREVLIGDPWARINIDILRKKEYYEKALKVSPILYATVIGSALRGLVKQPKEAGINLIKGQEKLLKK